MVSSNACRDCFGIVKPYLPRWLYPQWPSIRVTSSDSVYYLKLASRPSVDDLTLTSDPYVDGPHSNI